MPAKVYSVTLITYDEEYSNRNYSKRQKLECYCSKVIRTKAPIGEYTVYPFALIYNIDRPANDCYRYKGKSPLQYIHKGNFADAHEEYSRYFIFPSFIRNELLRNRQILFHGVYLQATIVNINLNLNH